MKIKTLLITSALILFSTFTVSALEDGESFSKSYRTGDQLDYPIRSKVADYQSSTSKNNIIYKILENNDKATYDVQVDSFIFRISKGDKFNTFYEKKENKDTFQSYIIRYYMSEEITSLSNNRIEISYKVTKVEKFYKKGLKSDYEQVTKFPWE